MIVEQRRCRSRPLFLSGFFMTSLSPIVPPPARIFYARSPLLGARENILHFVIDNKKKEREPVCSGSQMAAEKKEVQGRDREQSRLMAPCPRPPPPKEKRYFLVFCRHSHRHREPHRSEKAPLSKGVKSLRRVGTGVPPFFALLGDFAHDKQDKKGDCQMSRHAAKAQTFFSLREKRHDKKRRLIG